LESGVAEGDSRVHVVRQARAHLVHQVAQLPTNINFSKKSAANRGFGRRARRGCRARGVRVCAGRGVCRSGVQGSGFRVQGSGFMVQGSGFRVQGSGFRAQELGLRQLPSLPSSSLQNLHIQGYLAHKKTRSSDGGQPARTSSWPCRRPPPRA